jgi:hypothetical protein
MQLGRTFHRILFSRLGVQIAVTAIWLVAGAAHAVETISGTVRAQQGGAAIEGVDLDVFDLSGEKINSANTQTDVLGRYTVTLPGPGSFLLRADASVAQPFADQYFAGALLESDATAIAVELDEAVLGIDFDLPPGFLLSGRVTSSGAPLEGIDIDLFAPNGERLTGKPGSSGPDGKFTVGALAAGDYFVLADPALAAGQYYLPTFFDDAATIDDAQVVSVGAEDVSGIDIEVSAGGSIAGVVTDAATGLEVDGIDLDLFDNDGRRLESDSRTSSDGSYEIGVLPPGSYRMRADPSVFDGYAITYYVDAIGLSGSAPIQVSPGGPTTGIDLELEPSGRISGAVVATIGGPVDAIDIDVYDAATAERLVQGAESGPDGSYVVNRLKSGQYKLRADPAIEDGLALRYYDARSTRATADPITVKRGLTTSGITLVLEPGATISGQVTDTAGENPIENVDVALVQAGTLVDFDQVERTDADGRYVLFAVEAGSYLVRGQPRANEPFGATWFGDVADSDLATVIPVAAGAEVTGIDIALPEPGGRLASFVALLTLVGLTGVTRRERSPHPWVRGRTSGAAHR